MRRGTVIAVLVLLAACGSAPVASGQGPAPVVPVMPLLPVEPTALPPVPTFNIPAADPLALPFTALQPERRSDPPAPKPKDGDKGKNAEKEKGKEPPPEIILPSGASVVLPDAVRQTIRFGPRYGKLNDYTVDKQPDGVQRLTYSGGLKVNVVTRSDRPNERPQEVEFAADNVVVWVRGVKSPADLIGGGVEVDREEKKDGEEKDEKVTIELYMSGNVVIRMFSESNNRAPAGQPPTQQVLRANEVYYDVDKSRAICIDADLETSIVYGLDPVHLRGREMWRLGPREWRAYDTTLFSSKRPADPGLTMTSREATLVTQDVVKRNIFGRPYRNALTGDVDVSEEKLLTAYGNRVRAEGVPLLFLPRYKADLSDPTGPLLGVLSRQDQINGFQVYSTWDLYKLLALRAPPNHQWRMNIDYLSLRGPVFGTAYEYRNAQFGRLFPWLAERLTPFSGDPTRPAMPNVGLFTATIMHDKGQDLLGGFRGLEPASAYTSDRFRGRALWRHQQEWYEDSSTFVRTSSQFAFLSDKTYYEQFFRLPFEMDPNLETFGYAYGGWRNVAWSALGEVNVNRPWVSETNWLPRGDVNVIGQSFLDVFVYSSRLSAGYAQFKPASQDPQSTIPTESRQLNTGTADWYQRLSVPIDAGPVRLTPYGVADLTAYSETLDGSSQGRLYGGGGVRASLPLSRLYADVNSDLFNVRGINHKVTVGANYFAGYSSLDRTRLPLLNRLNDDNLDLTYRSWRPLAYGYVPGPTGLALTNSPIYDPQTLAVRRLVDSRPETLDTLQVLQFDLRQRWQTKRGLPGADHTVDWMSLDLSASVYPNPNRDNFGQSLGFLEGNYVWNIGDRTAFNFQTWIDPLTNGARYYNAGVWYNRPDGSNFYLSYRHTDPLNSRVLITSMGYQLSTKYNMTLTNVFDFGSNVSQSASVTFNRFGPDTTMSFGFTFSALQGNSLGFQFLILPNSALAPLAPGTSRGISPLAFTGGR